MCVRVSCFSFDFFLSLWGSPNSLAMNCSRSLKIPPIFMNTLISDAFFPRVYTSQPLAIAGTDLFTCFTLLIFLMPRVGLCCCYCLPAWIQQHKKVSGIENICFLFSSYFSTKLIDSLIPLHKKGREVCIGSQNSLLVYSWNIYEVGTGNKKWKNKKKTKRNSVE